MGIGTTSHAMGTAGALLEAETCGAMLSLAVGGAAVLDRGLGPGCVTFLLRLFGYAS